MGLSHVSLAKDSDAIFWNSALIPYSNTAEIKAMGTKAFETRYFSIQSIFHVLGHPFGISLMNAYVGDIKETSPGSTPGRYAFSGNTLDYNATALFFSSGKTVLNNLNIGTSLKWLQEKAAGYEANGIGADVGIVIIPFDHLTLGMNIQNLIQPTLKWNTPSGNRDTIPMNIKVGANTHFFNNNLITSIDFNFRGDRETQLNFGIEYWLIENLPFRAGLDQGELSLGLGINLNPLHLNFSWKNSSMEYIEDVYKVSIGYRFKKKGTAKLI